MMEHQSGEELIERNRMLPPPAGSFQNREDLIKHVRDFAMTQGYVVSIKKSRKERSVILGCDRGGVYRNRHTTSTNIRQRKTCSRLINCPFEVVGRKRDGVWTLSIRNGEHNHEALEDITDHPSCRRFTEEEMLQIKEMTVAGVKPREILRTLGQKNPNLTSTSRSVYNIIAKIRQGNLPG